jgi:hypothetical protein
MRDTTNIQFLVSKILKTPSFVKELKDFELEQILKYFKDEDIKFAGLAMSANPPLEKRQIWNWGENNRLGEIVRSEIMRRNKIEEPATPAYKRLTWNGQKNTLADVFYQLKMLYNDKGQPFLDASNEALAQFLKDNFECFKDTSIGTIQNYFEMPEKRPKKTKDKIHLKRGGE